MRFFWGCLPGLAVAIADLAQKKGTAHLALTLILGITLLGGEKVMAQDSLYALQATTIDGKVVALSEFNGKVALVVNVASQCGYTQQYAGLQSLYEKYQARGFVVLGFPSNDFGGQEPGSDTEIKHFCSSKFGVTFPLFSKVAVLGPQKHPVYQYLTAATGGDDVGWNFEKFLVDANGRVVVRFKPGVRPDGSELAAAIEQLVGKS